MRVPTSRGGIGGGAQTLTRGGRTGLGMGTRILASACRCIRRWEACQPLHVGGNAPTEGQARFGARKKGGSETVIVCSIQQYVLFTR